MLNGWGNCEETHNFGNNLWKKTHKNAPKIDRDEKYQPQIVLLYRFISQYKLWFRFFQAHGNGSE